MQLYPRKLMRNRSDGRTGSRSQWSKGLYRWAEGEQVAYGGGRARPEHQGRDHSARGRYSQQRRNQVSSISHDRLPRQKTQGADRGDGEYEKVRRRKRSRKRKHPRPWQFVARHGNSDSDLTRSSSQTPSSGSRKQRRGSTYLDKQRGHIQRVAATQRRKCVRGKRESLRPSQCHL